MKRFLSKFAICFALLGLAMGGPLHGQIFEQPVAAPAIAMPANQGGQLMMLFDCSNCYQNCMDRIDDQEACLSCCQNNSCRQYCVVFEMLQPAGPAFLGAMPMNSQPIVLRSFNCSNCYQNCMDKIDDQGACLECCSNGTCIQYCIEFGAAMGSDERGIDAVAGGGNIAMPSVVGTYQQAAAYPGNIYQPGAVYDQTFSFQPTSTYQPAYSYPADCCPPRYHRAPVRYWRSNCWNPCCR
ncbi:MAG: hypothetical protein AAF456_01555 [Planctomycetota bacterium]